MKIIYAIISSDDGNRVTEVLNENQFMVTKLATTGGELYIDDRYGSREGGSCHRTD